MKEIISYISTGLLPGSIIVFVTSV